MADQVDLFLDSLVDAPLKDDRALMEFPFFAITKTPHMEPMEYRAKDVFIRVTPSVKGAATIWDRDILMYIASVLNDRMERKLPVQPTVRFPAHDFLRATKRGTGKRSYELLKDALFRLRATTVETDIKSGRLGEDRGFGWIANYVIEYDVRPDGSRRMLWIEITLCQWMYRAIVKDRRVLTINRAYFDLGGGLERRLYQLARKHCGDQPKWEIKLPKLLDKVGSRQDLRFFKRDLKRIIENDSIPDYIIGMVGDPASEIEAELTHEGFRTRLVTSNEGILVIFMKRETASDEG